MKPPTKLNKSIYLCQDKHNLRWKNDPSVIALTNEHAIDFPLVEWSYRPIADSIHVIFCAEQKASAEITVIVWSELYIGMAICDVFPARPHTHEFGNHLHIHLRIQMELPTICLPYNPFM